MGHDGECTGEGEWAGGKRALKATSHRLSHFGICISCEPDHSPEPVLISVFLSLRIIEKYLLCLGMDRRERQMGHNTRA